jgi:two-component system response regulator HydG
VGSYGIITSDKRIADDVTRWGQTDVRVLIEGDTGVGKELVARAMHAMSRRREERFVAVDCGALSESLAESELFGHAKGSFTGALRDRAGLIEEADGGTLFLDEVGELTEVLQAKLLRVLEEGAVRRVGENPLRAVNIRILSATTKDLWAEVEAGRFRRDLYYRLKGVVVRVPSLRERPGDVELLLDHFAGRYCEAYGRSVEIGDKARELFLEYEWPGNVRELRHVVEALVASGRDGEVIEADRAAEFLEATRSGSAPDGESSGVDREKMERALDASGGNKAEAARRLGISRKTLYRKMQRPQTE